MVLTFVSAMGSGRDRLGECLAGSGGGLAWGKEQFGIRGCRLEAAIRNSECVIRNLWGRGGRGGRGANFGCGGDLRARPIGGMSGGFRG